MRISTGEPLTRSFYRRPAVQVAPALLGAVLVHETAEGRVAGVIVETEAYGGARDPASHACRGRTPRNATMFGPPGHAYVYFTYGMHHCVNVVTGEDGEGSAVLVRAVSPIEGLDFMAQRRGLARGADGRDGAGPVLPKRLASGPGMLCQAFALTRQDDGRDLTSGALRIERGARVPRAHIVRLPRVGIRSAMDRLWRFVLRDAPGA